MLVWDDAFAESSDFVTILKGPRTTPLSFLFSPLVYLYLPIYSSNPNHTVAFFIYGERLDDYFQVKSGNRRRANFPLSFPRACDSYLFYL
jgi:hypothetical protein